LTGDAAATDPACSLSPQHYVMQEALQVANSAQPVSQPGAFASFAQVQRESEWKYRVNAE